MRDGAQRQCQTLLPVLLKAMSALTLLVMLVKTTLQNSKVAHGELDGHTCQHIQHRSEFLPQQMMWMLEELEHKAVEQTGGSQGLCSGLPCCNSRLLEFWCCLWHSAGSSGKEAMRCC